MSDYYPAARTCVECGETFGPEGVDSSGRCRACRQAAEKFIDDFSMSLGHWAQSLKSRRPGPPHGPAAADRKKITIPRLVLAAVLVAVGYFTYNFITNYHLIQTQWFLERGHIDKAQFHLEKAIEADSQDPNLRFIQGTLYYQQGKLNPAIEAYQRTLELDSLHAGALNNLAWIYTQLNVRLDEALGLSKRSLELEPDNPYYLDTMAEVYFLKKEYYRALTYMRKAMAQDPPNIEYYRRRLEIIKSLVNRQGHLIEV